MPTFGYTAAELDAMLKKAAAASDAKASAEASAAAAADSATEAAGSASAAGNKATEAAESATEAASSASDAASGATEAAGSASAAAASATAAAGYASNAAGALNDMKSFLSHMAVRYSGWEGLPTSEYWNGVGMGDERCYYIDLPLKTAWDSGDKTIFAQAPALSPGNIRITHKPVTQWSDWFVCDPFNVRGREIISHVCLVEPEIREEDQGPELWARIWSTDPPKEDADYDAYVYFYWEVIWETDYEAAGILDEEAF